MQLDCIGSVDDFSGRDCVRGFKGFKGFKGSCREEAVQQLEVEAAARELEGFKGFKRLKPGKRQA